MSPVHRPPRSPDDRHPHCHWTVDIDPTRLPLTTPERCALVGATNAAHANPTPWTDGTRHDGWLDYSGELEADLRMEHFSSATLSAIAQEAALQGHLLVASFTSAVTDAHGLDVAIELAERQFAGVAGVVALRMAKWIDQPAGLESIAEVFELHPAFHPRDYVDWTVELDDTEVVLHLGDCAALAETATPSWITLLADGAERPLQTIARGVDARAVVEAAPRRGRHVWTVRLGDEANPLDDDVALTMFSSGASFEFQRTGPVPTTSTTVSIST